MRQIVYQLNANRANYNKNAGRVKCTCSAIERYEIGFSERE